MTDPPEGAAELPSELGALGDLYGVLYTLTADRTDVSGYAQVLTDALGTAFPPGMVEVARERGMGDRLADRPGRATTLTVHGQAQELELRAGRHGQVEAEVRQVVRGVVISRRTVGVDAWLRALADELQAQAGRAAASREALRRLLGG